MPAATSTDAPTHPPILAWRRVRVVLIPCTLFALLLSPGWNGSHAVLFGRLYFEGLSALAVFGMLERWPRRLPGWIARWGLQIVGMAITIPFFMAFAYFATTQGDPKPWYHDNERMIGYSMLTFLGLLIAPWMGVAALLQQIRGDAERQALAFELERSELERQAVDTRMRLLQAQVEPHFLFNTLANVRELVESGSPQASVVLGNLIAYLRAAVPRLHEGGATLAQEIDLVRAYLEVMHMRMPDRLQFTLHADDAAQGLFCPPMSVLTLVENAVRHGIDPSEQGGRIEVRARVRDSRCFVDVIDTGVGPTRSGDGLGTGLKNLRERMNLAFGGDAVVRIAPLEPRGTCAELEFPARTAAP